MRKYKKVLKNDLSDIVCDFCSQSCTKQGEDVETAEFAVINAQWGYWSRKDGENCSLDVCENCFDKIMSFTETISSKP